MAWQFRAFINSMDLGLILKESVQLTTLALAILYYAHEFHCPL